MRNAVFTTGQQWNGSFAPDGLRATINGIQLAGSLFQAVQVNFQMQVTMLYEVGSNFVYLVGGRASGTMAVGAVAGPSELSVLLLRDFRDMCNPVPEIGFSTTRGCSAANSTFSGSFYLEDVVMTGIGFGITANDVVVRQNMQFIFLNMSIDEPTSIPQAVRGFGGAGQAFATTTSAAATNRAVI